jgi:hypothetical protein
METNAKIKAEQILKDLCKIITAPSGQDARVSNIDKLVAKNCAVYMIDKLCEELDFTDGRNELMANIAYEINNNQQLIT